MRNWYSTNYLALQQRNIAKTNHAKERLITGYPIPKDLNNQ